MAPVRPISAKASRFTKSVIREMTRLWVDLHAIYPYLVRRAMP